MDNRRLFGRPLGLDFFLAGLLAVGAAMLAMLFGPAWEVVGLYGRWPAAGGGTFGVTLVLLRTMMLRPRLES